MKEKHFSLVRWLPVAGSLLVVALIAIISGITLKEMREARYWRQHTVDTILEAQSAEDDLIHAQGRVLRYTTEGTPNLLVEYQVETNAELKEYSKLSTLTSDDPEQKARLRELDSAVKALFDYDNRVIGVYARQGASAALQMEGQGEKALETAVDDVEKFKMAEEKLLDKRDAVEQTDFHKATRVLVAGSIVAALLLVLANYFAGREMARRKQGEIKRQQLIEELQQALAEVKTLSGLIPICGWCKKVRSDEGFWQSVESYVTHRTDARFSHGMCPNCAKDWQASVERSAAAETKTNAA